jgi:hypothetical protein
MGLWDVEATIFSRQSAHSWQWDCQTYAPAALYPPPSGRFPVLISVTGWVDLQAIVRPEALDTLEIPVTSSGMEAATFRLVARCLYKEKCSSLTGLQLYLFGALAGNVPNKDDWTSELTSHTVEWWACSNSAGRAYVMLSSAFCVCLNWYAIMNVVETPLRH